jgi:hypothetical protein
MSNNAYAKLREGFATIDLTRESVLQCHMRTAACASADTASTVRNGTVTVAVLLAS